MRTRLFSVLAATVAAVSIGGAQEPVPARDTSRAPMDTIRPAVTADSARPAPPPVSRDLEMALHRVRSLVNEGRGNDGRKLMDSLSRNVDSSSHAYASVLLTRSMVAPDISQAVRDLRRIVVEHAMTAPAETALVRLAQIEMQRGDRVSALRHLERLMVEYTTAGARARGAFLAARIYRENSDEARACEALGRARRWVPANEIELANQIDYAVRPCPPPPVATVSPPVMPAPAVAAPTTVPPVTSAAPDTSRRVAAQATPPRPAATSTSAQSAPARPVTTAPAAAPPPVPSVSASQPTSRPATGRFSVQVAAFSTLPDAQRAAAAFTQAGLDARVDGTAAPFRVRIGRYATSAEAKKVAEDFRRRGQAAFVVVVDPR